MTEHRRDRRQILKGAGALGALGALAGLPRAPRALAAPAEQAAEGIVGTWITTALNPPGSHRPSTQQLTLYTSDGGITASDSVPLSDAPLFPGAAQYPNIGAMGRWSKTDTNAYATTILRLVSNLQHHGALDGYVRIRQRLTLAATGDTLSGEGVVEHLTPAGKVVYTRHVKSQATRVTVVPLTS
jgi:TAT (twin-arginine translocation) pathway signal sequence